MTPRLIASPRFWLALASIVCAVVYWPGLSGPFLFDDPENFAPLGTWLQGETSWQQVVLGDQPLWLSRPLAMATFLLSAALGQGEAFHFKLGNLLIHLACGWLIYAVLRRLLQRDGRLQPHGELAAPVLAILWMLHPLHVSTVLYAVQRMTQLSALFTLLALIAYLHGRSALSSKETRRAALLLFLAFPLAVCAGLLSKQNAATTPLLCLVVELAYFSRAPGDRKFLGIFFGLFIILPALCVALALAVRPQALLAGYLEYDFTLMQRLLSQPRALFDYLGQIVLPRGPLMGLYSDDFAISTGLLTPPSTWMALAGLGLISALAIAVRNRAPSIFAGWFFFLAAHAVESSFLPLDLYFEHRNYLPSVGILLAGVGLLSLLPQQLATNVLTPRQLVLLASVVAVAGLTFSTLGRSLVWSDKQAIVVQGLKAHPDSLRARMDLTALAQTYGRFDIYDQQMTLLKQSDDRQARMLGHLYTLSLACHLGKGGEPDDLRAAVANAGARITPAEVLAYRAILGNSEKRGCGRVTDGMLAASMVQMLDAADSQPETARNKWIFRSMTAETFLRSGDVTKAARHARTAWESGAGPGVGTLLATIHLQGGQVQAAEDVLTRLVATTPCHDRRAVDRIRMLSDALKQVKAVTASGTHEGPPLALCVGN